MKRYLLILFAFFTLVVNCQNSGRIIFGTGNIIFQSGTVIFTPPPTWLNNLHLHNIDTIPLLVDYTYNLQNDEISLIPIGENSTVTYEYTCDIGSYTNSSGVPINNTSFQKSGFYVISPSSSDLGYHTVDIDIKYKGITYNSISKVFHVINNANASGTKTIMFVGNSITSQGENTMIDSVRRSLNGITPDMVGTYGTVPNEHVGIPGYTFADFLSTNSPFWDGAAININGYRVDSLSLTEPIDYAVINLGVNDMFNFADTLTIESTLMPRVANLISKFTADTTVNIIIACPTQNENSGVGWTLNYPSISQNDYNEKMNYFKRRIIETYDNFNYDTNVFVSMHANYLDRDDGYPVDGSGNHNNGVHPNSTGQYEIANSVTSTIERILLNNFIDARYTQSTEGADLIDANGNGTTIPYVSGSGLDQLFDFSVMNDFRYNKNAYSGNAFSLPEYYNFPWDAFFYFDTSNPYHWKLQDFHYRNFEEQADLITNFAFANLIYSPATVIDSVGELLLFANEQLGATLSALLDSVDVDTFFSAVEEITDGAFASSAAWGLQGESVVNSGSGNVLSSDGSISSISQSAMTIGLDYRLTFDLINVTTGRITVNNAPNVVASGLDVVQTYEYIFEAAGTVINFSRWFGITDCRIDNVSINEAFVNYYTNELP